MFRSLFLSLALLVSPLAMAAHDYPERVAIINVETVQRYAQTGSWDCYDSHNRHSERRYSNSGHLYGSQHGRSSHSRRGSLSLQWDNRRAYGYVNIAPPSPSCRSRTVPTRSYVVTYRYRGYIQRQETDFYPGTRTYIDPRTGELFNDYSR